MILRPYQKELVDAVWDGFFKKQNQLVVAPTSSGKTECFIALCERAIAAKSDIKILIVLNRVGLVEQTLRRMRVVIPNASVYCGSLNKKETGSVTIASIQSISKAELEKINLVILDEAHNLSEQEDSHYQTLLSKINHDKLKVVGFTATPYRPGGYLYGEGKFFESIDYQIKLETLISQGFVVRPTMKHSDFQFDPRGLKITNGDYDNGQLSKLVEDVDKANAQVSDAIPRLIDRKKIAWACATIKHAEIIKELLPSSVVVHSKNTKDLNDYNKRQFEFGNIRHLVFVSMLSEGIDIPCVDAIVMMRPTRSAVRYIQCLDDKTEILTKEGWRGRLEIKPTDLVAAVDLNLQSIFVPILEIFDREVGQNEKMVELSNPSTDIRVTENHRMLYRPKSNNGWSFLTALELASRTNSSIIPCASIEQTEGLPLTDEEIMFIAWIATDGCINKKNKQAVISQSTTNPNQISEIKRVLKSCNFKYGVYTKKHSSNFIRNGEDSRFYISYGNPVGTYKDKRGWKHLDKYVSKNFETTLELMDERQFDIFLKTANDADGSKHKPKNWTMRSYHITKGNKLFIDRVQSMAVRRGWKCNVSTIPVRGVMKKNQYCLHLKKGLDRHVKGTNGDAPGFRISQSIIGERVWCVQNELGTLITRRNGKVTIMGNCVGRALRLFPGKTDALILDYGKVVQTLGPLTNPLIIEKGSGKKKLQKLLMKFCKNCLEYIDITAIVCPMCEHSTMPPASTGIPKNLSDEHKAFDLISNQKIKNNESVYGVYLSAHVSKNKNECLKITYQTLIGNIHEYFMWDNNYAQSKGFKRLDELGIKPHADLLDQARELVLKKPISIEYEIDKGYKKITRLVF